METLFFKSGKCWGGGFLLHYTTLLSPGDDGEPKITQALTKGIHQDYAAVKAAFSSEWSNGQVEAQVNCLKLQKRIVFGRANFDLLRLRVLSRV
jgi:hypothetical protein